MDKEKLTKFDLNGVAWKVTFVHMQIVTVGVKCDIYIFDDDYSKDLAIVTVKKGCKTPLQRVLLGETTLEGLYSGSGTLVIDVNDEQSNKYTFDHGKYENVEVKIGQTMQWHADKNTDLVFYEICQPAYSEGRFEDIAE